MISNLNSNNTILTINQIALIQINLQRAKIATSILGQIKELEDTKFYLVQEPYIKNNQIVGIPNKWRQLISKNRKAGIIITDCNLNFTIIKQGTNLVCIEISDKGNRIRLISAYSSPKENIENLLIELEPILNTNVDCLIGGDFNAHNVSWGYTDNDRRGQVLEDFLASTNLIVLNEENAPHTFQQNYSVGWPDLTITNSKLISETSSWEVLEDNSLSDHKYIKIILNKSLTCNKLIRYKTKFGNFKKFDKELNKHKSAIINNLNSINSIVNLEETTVWLLGVINDCCKSAFKLKGAKPFKENKWWTAELNNKRKLVNALRRRYQKEQEASKKKVFLIKFKKQRAILKKSIFNRKRAFWKEYCSKAVDCYGRHYKIAFAKGSPPAPIIQSKFSSKDESPLSNAENILREIFVEGIQPPLDVSCGNSNIDQDFTMEEIKQALNETNNNKAPGWDGIDYLILKRIQANIPEMLKALYNKCLFYGYFPKPFKKGIVLLFKKEDKPIEDISSYRPVTLLPTMGKLLEKLLVTRMNFYLEFNKELNKRQFGFRAGLSTESALQSLLEALNNHRLTFKHSVIVSIDIKGAFDSLKYETVMEELNKSHIPQNLRKVMGNYFRDRFMQIQAGEEWAQIQVCRGSPQGSCSGPLCWNLVANKLLNESFDFNTHIQAYADDFVLLISANTIAELENSSKKALDIVQKWSEEEELRISETKTNYCLFGVSKAKPKIFLGNFRIKRCQNFRYLGVFIDAKLNWAAHLKFLKLKARKILNKIQRITGSHWGINNRYRMLIYKTVVEPALTYGAGTWGKNLNVRNSKQLITIQRMFLLHLTGAYRTTSSQSLQVLLGIPPLNLTVKLQADKSNLLIGNKPIRSENCLFKKCQFENTKKNLSTHPAITIEKSLKIEENFIPYTESNIFTDGSKTEEGTGAAFHSLLENKKYRLNKENSVFQAELLAIKEAISFVASAQPLQPTTIWTDSQAAIKAIGIRYHPSDLVQEIRKMLVTHNLITISWIKGHAGFEGNETADALAKEAILNGIPTQLALPISHLRKLLLNNLLKEWQREWDETDLSARVKDCCPKVSCNNNWTRQEIQFQTGHGPFPTYFERFKIKGNGNCACGELGSPDHFITSCPITISWHNCLPSNASRVEWRKMQWENKHVKSRIRLLMNFLKENEDLICNLDS